MNWAAVRTSAILALGALLVGLIALLAWAPSAGRPHEVAVGIVAPGVTGELLVESVRGTAGELVPVEVDDLDEGLELLNRGELAAVVTVDLSRTRDTIWVSHSQDPDLATALSDRITSIEHRYGRTVRVSHAAGGSPGRHAHIDWVTSLAVGAGALLGILVATVRWLRRSPVIGLPRTLLVITPAACLAGLFLAATPALGTGHDWWFTALFLAVLTGVSAGLTLASIAASPRYGLAVALAVHLTLVAPLLNGIPQAMLPQPWHFLHPLTPPGAVRSALSVATDEWAWRSILVLAVWVVAVAVSGTIAVHRSGDWEDELPLMRSARPVLVGLAAVVAGALVLPTGPPDPPVDKVLATSTECIDPGAVRTTADLNRIARLRVSAEFGGADVGASATLQDGRTVWMFGDTVRTAESTESSDFTRNSMLVMDPECIQMVQMPDRGAVIPDRDNEVGYWPMSLTVSPAKHYDLVTVMAQRVAATGRGAWDFTSLGPAAAVYVVPRGGVPQLMAVRDIGEDTRDQSEPMWGAASTVEDGWLYLYGTASPGEYLVFGYSLRVARVRPDDVLKASAWRYWDGVQWQRDPEASAELIPASSGTSQTLSVWQASGVWYALSKRDEYLGNDLVVWTAQAPTGPFTAHPPVKELPSDLTSGSLRYMPLAHPDLLPQDGTVVVSWSNNKADPQEVLDNPLLYRNLSR